jgi:hypothetical protein
MPTSRMWDLIEKSKNEGLSEQERQELQELFLQDPDEGMFIRMKKGLEPDLTFDEAVHLQLEHDIKTLAKRRGWIRR